MPTFTIILDLYGTLEVESDQPINSRSIVF